MAAAQSFLAVTAPVETQLCSSARSSYCLRSEEDRLWLTSLSGSTLYSRPIAPAMPPTLRSACTVPVFSHARTAPRVMLSGSVCEPSVTRSRFSSSSMAAKTVSLISPSLSLMACTSFCSVMERFAACEPMARICAPIPLRAEASSGMEASAFICSEALSAPLPSVPPEREISEGSTKPPTPAPIPADVLLPISSGCVSMVRSASFPAPMAAPIPAEASPTVRSAPPVTLPSASAPASIVAVARRLLAALAAPSRYVPIPASCEPRVLAAPPASAVARSVRVLRSCSWVCSWSFVLSDTVTATYGSTWPAMPPTSLRPRMVPSFVLLRRYPLVEPAMPPML